MVEHSWLKSYPKHIEWDFHPEPKPLYAILDEAAERFPWNSAIDFFGKKFTYSFLQREVNSVAQGLRDMGVNKGTKIGIFLPNCPQFVISYFAILKAGATVVNFSPLYSESELKHQLLDSETEIIITLNLESLYPKLKNLIGIGKLRNVIISTLQEALPFPKNFLFPLLKKKEIVKIPADDVHVKWKTLTHSEEITELPEIDVGNDIAVIQYTGGTTGTPKGAMLSHKNLYANVIQCGMWFGEEENIAEGQEKILGILPFFHVFAMTVAMNFSILKGAEIILHPRFELISVLKDIAKKKPTLMPGVPTIFTAINNHEHIGKYDLSSLKACLSGGAPLPLEVKNKFEELSGCALIEGYGLTETSPVAAANLIKALPRKNSIGLPFPATIIEIENIEHRGSFLPAGEKGEICIKGPQVMKGYWNNPSETAKALDDEGRFRSGDIAYMDGDGYIYIVDRLKELILCGGFNIYPRNVEDAIYKHEAVLEAAVIGVPDEYRGQTVKAFVALKNGWDLTEVELIEFLRTHLGKHEVPEMVEFRHELPKTMIGKIDKKSL